MMFLTALFTVLTAFLLLWLNFFESKRRKQSLQTQLLSLRLCAAVKDLLVKVQQHRGMVMTYLKGDTAFQDKILTLQKDIDRSLRSMDRLINANSAYSEELNPITNAWRVLRQDVFTFSGDRCYAEHNRLIDQILNFLATTAEQNQLKAGNRFSTEYVHVIWHLIPTTAEALGRARAIGSGIAAANGSRALDRIQLGFLINKITFAMERVTLQLDKITDTENEIRRLFSQLHPELSRLISVMETQLLSNEKTTVGAVEFFDQVTHLLSKIYSLYDAGETMVVQALESDIAQVDSSGKLTLGSAAIGIALVSASSYFVV
ncbi:MAG: nitrate- and nitrite sensing domain-containing protein [Gammaproteobacteria bacterium]